MAAVTLATSARWSISSMQMPLSTPRHRATASACASVRLSSAPDLRLNMAYRYWHMIMCSSCDASVRRYQRCSRLSTTRTGSSIRRPRGAGAGRGAAPPEGAAGRRSLGPPALDPGPEEVDLCRRPGAVARHRAVPETREDRIGVPADVVVRPQVEPGLHRLPVTLAEQGLDVGFKAGGTGEVVRHLCS